MIAPDRTLSTNLGDMADGLAPYLSTGITLEPLALQAMVLLLIQCQAVAKALEVIAAEHQAVTQMAEDVQQLGPAGQVVDLSAFLARRSADVVQFPGGAA